MDSIKSAEYRHPILEQYGVTEKTVKIKKNLDRDAFMRLLIAQMNNQNPLQPQDNGQFIAQLTEFSSLEGIEKLNSTVGTVVSSFQSERALQASTMVGQHVVVENTKTSQLEKEHPIVVYAELPSSTSQLMVQIEGPGGDLKEQFALGMHSSGSVQVSWDGWHLALDGKPIAIEESIRKRKSLAAERDPAQSQETLSELVDNPYPSGDYKIKLLAQADGKTEDLGALMSSRVESVTLAQDRTMTLNLSGGQSVALDDVKIILD